MDPELLSNVLLTWLNGAIAFGQTVITPVTFATLVVIGGLLYCAWTEVEELDRQGGKPVVENH